MFLVASTPRITPQNQVQIQMYHRPSSPLNPNHESHSHQAFTSPSTIPSSPLTSPTPAGSGYDSYQYNQQNVFQPFPNFGSSSKSSSLSGSGSNTVPPPPAWSITRPPPQIHQNSTTTTTTRYKRPTAPKRHSLPSPSISPSHPQPRTNIDLFGSGSGSFGGNDTNKPDVSPLEASLWKERFSRRAAERERRKKNRQEDIKTRRSLPFSSSSPLGSDPDVDNEEEEADRKAQEDDEEIFRRLVILQQKRARHAVLVSHEQETGGSDPLLPEFWENEDEDEIKKWKDEERVLLSYFGDEPIGVGRRFQTPPRRNFHGRIIYRMDTASSPFQTLRENEDEDQDDEEDRWAEEAAEAEEAEREAEEAELARQVEEEYGMGIQDAPRRNQSMDMDVDWEAFDAMDIE